MAVRIVIVGGGVAGLEVATRLGRRMGRRGEAEITLVDRSLAHVWKPILHTFAAGTADADREEIPFVAQGKRECFRFWPGEIDSLDRAARTVTLKPLALADGQIIPGAILDYDTLVLAIGSQANDFGTKGVREHALFIEDLAGAEHFYKMLRARTLAAAAGLEDKLHMAIVGAGATGVELAAEIHRALGIADGYRGTGVQGRLRLSLIEGGPRILPAFSEKVSKQACTALEERGIEVLTRAEVVGVDADAVHLKNGDHRPSALTVWAAGIRGDRVLGALDGLETSRHGQLAIRPTLQTTRDDRVFAIGDCATLIAPGATSPLPATAQVAHEEAKHLSAHLPAFLRQGTTPPEFNYRDRGSIVSLGPYTGWGTLGRSGLFKGLEFRGWLAAASHAWLYRQNQLLLFGVWRGLVNWLGHTLTNAVRPRVKLD